jgi:hypothetical protein
LHNHNCEKKKSILKYISQATAPVISTYTQNYIHVNCKEKTKGREKYKKEYVSRRAN